MKQITNFYPTALLAAVKDRDLDMPPYYPCETEEKRTIWIFCLVDEELIREGEGEGKVEKG
jgi:hypothetical protein